LTIRFKLFFFGVIAATAALTFGIGSAFSKQVSTLAELTRFGTLHEAVMYDAVRLERCSHYYECAGVIAIDPSGKFVASAVHSDYAGDHVSMNHDVPPGWVLAADIHSHPCVPHHVPSMFSPQDMIGSIITRTTSFMVDFCTGDVHEFIPGVTRPDLMPVDNIWLTPGIIVGHVPAFALEPTADEGI
jgi:hypothetical protein